MNADVPTPLAYPYCQVLPNGKGAVVLLWNRVADQGTWRLPVGRHRNTDQQRNAHGPFANQRTRGL
jgi:hypothetical protein